MKMAHTYNRHQMAHVTSNGSVYFFISRRFDDDGDVF
jgi:hypothetical protein